MDNSAADGPRDALCRLKSCQLLHNSIGTSCTTEQQEIDAMELEGYSWPTCSKQPRLVDCRTGVVNKLDRRRVLLATRQTWRVEIF